MITYLYVKTHTISGLKYLGQTSNKDPHKYQGSGKYWRRHLKAHGATYTTEILKECEHPAMVKFWGQYYSDLWNVVESDEWANLKPETGQYFSSEVKMKMSFGNKGQIPWNKGLPRSEETKAKISASSKGKKSTSMKDGYIPWNKGLPMPEEGRKKRSETLKGRPKSIETRAKMAAGQRRRFGALG